MLDRERRGAVTVATTILYADRFAFYTDEVRHMHQIPRINCLMACL